MFSGVDTGPSHPVHAQVDPFAALASRPADAAPAATEQVRTLELYKLAAYATVLMLGFVSVEETAASTWRSSLSPASSQATTVGCHARNSRYTIKHQSDYKNIKIMIILFLSSAAAASSRQTPMRTSDSQRTPSSSAGARPGSQIGCRPT